MDFDKTMNFSVETDKNIRTREVLKNVYNALQKKGYKIIEIQVEMEDRSEGESYFANPLKTIKFMFNVLMSIIFVQ